MLDHIMNGQRFDRIPLILETIDETIWGDEISWLRSLQIEQATS
ncbi:hypothetical protein [Aeromonas rivipollensis]